jgi:hypothetical protein
LDNDETANYVTAERHPIDIWQALTSEQQDKHRDDLVFIDAYSPRFAFTDDIHEENDRQLGDKRVTCIKAKTFAGLHTALAEAFNVFKARETQDHDGRGERRPMVVMFVHVSALCDMESVEPFRVFWRHVIPSERNYGVITLILEDAQADPEILAPLKQLAAFVFVAEEKKRGEVMLVGEK